MAENKELMTQPEGSVAIMTVEDYTKKEIKKFSLPDKKIAELKTKSLALKVAGIEDKAGYKALVQQLSIVRSTRTGIEKKREELKSIHLKVGKAIDTEAKRLTALVEEIEQPMVEAKKAIDDEIEFQANEKKRIEEELVNSRINLMIEKGMAFDGSYYAIGEQLSLSVVEVRAMSEDNFNAFMERVDIEAEKAAEQEKQRKEQEEKDRLERERLQQIENDRIAEQQRENERLRKENEENQRKLQEQENQNLKLAQDLENQRLQMYQTDLRSIGFEYLPNLQIWSFKTPAFGEVNASISELKLISLDKWPSSFQMYKEASLLIHNKQVEWNDQQAKQAEENRIKREKEANERREQQEREAKEKEDRQRPDIEKVKNYFASVYALEIPTLQDPEIINAFNLLHANFTNSMLNFEKAWDKK